MVCAFGYAEPADAICAGEVSRSMAAALRIEQEWPLRPSQDSITRYLQNLGERLLPRGGSWLKWLRADDWPASGWFFFTVRDRAINAFSIGNGRIYLTDGSFDFVDNEAELAAIVAHEIGHQLAGHFCQATDRTGREQNSLGSLVQVVDIEKEMEADAIALKLLSSAGFPPQALLKIISRLPLTGNSAQQRLRLDKLNEKLQDANVSPLFSSSRVFLQLKKSLPR